jgi:demethylmacrocin O-methyltransferase
MKTLDEICLETQTDKASKHPTVAHNYAIRYDALFSPLRLQPIRLLEIGVGSGNSIEAWLEYFQNGQIFGVDNQKDTNPWNIEYGVLPSPRYFFAPGDQGDVAFWERLIHFYGGDGFDIIIDDGSHINTDIIVTFIALWQHVKPGGFYAIEDLSTGYGNYPFFVRANLPSHIDFLKGKLDELNQGVGDIDSIYFARELCVMRKAVK